ncbi:hypothetical protein FHS19_000694 [Paenibacillus rhizosphaerae]|uniref:Uncharacterized protein n=1 Tax=Paenibacillus rhizosphaerae TaxID=297318 RepID=A0A839TJW5_9BACL|nr:DUF3891 family protein [Paenibacillus rhizosphaerae]MBB3126040.1 hypothetical protein [Paenibacillus rhizosphaerae]
MILRERQDSFVLIRQHDHAKLSGQIAEHLLPNWMPTGSDREAAVLAITQHDRGWIYLDQNPLWDSESSSPFSFINYPLEPKLSSYRAGLDEAEAMNPYAGLLCSMHYASFHQIRYAEEPKAARFYKEELLRQERIQSQLIGLDDSRVERHFNLLKLCDSLSLYVCLNEAGASKEEEHPWYREGIETEIAGLKPLQARWVDEGVVAVSPPLFRSEFTGSITLKQVSRQAIAEKGLGAAYDMAPEITQDVIFRNK